MTSWISSTPETVFHDVCAAQSRDVRIAALPSIPTLIIVPTSRQREDVLIQWARAHGRGEPPTIMTMAGLYRALAPQVLEIVPRILPDSSVEVLLQHAMDVCDLPRGSVRLRASRIVRWAQELRSPAWLRDAAARHPSNRGARQLATAARIWESYEDLLGSRAADRGTYSRRIVDGVRVSNCNALRAPSGDAISHCLVIDTHGVTGVDAELLQSLATSGWDIAVQFAPEVPSLDDERVSRTERDMQWFVAQGWHIGAHRAVALPESERCIVPCTTRADEVRRAVALCKEAASKGVACTSMAITVPGDQRYVDRLRQACAESGVPVHTGSTQSLALTHTASLLHACCRVLTGGWLREDVERVVREPLVRDLVRNGPALLVIAREERIVGGGGVDEWVARIEQRHSDMRALAEREGDDNDHAKRNAGRYAYALRTLRDLRVMLDAPTHGMMDVDRFVSILLTRIAVGIDLEQRSAEHEPWAFAAIRDACSAYMAVHRDHELPACSFATHLHRWWTIIRATEVASTERARMGVRIVRPAELRGMAYELVVAVGCIEGEYPRTTVNQLDEDVVPDVQRHLTWESLADIAFAVAPGGTLVCTYPTTLDGSPVLPSTPLDALGTLRVGSSRWRSADPDVTCIVHPRDLRVNPAHAPVMRTSQDGDVRILLHEEAQRVLQDDLARPISPSRLDVVIQCPYRFFAQSLLRLDDLDIDDVRLSPLERGNLLHDIVDRWYRRLRTVADVELTQSGLRSAAINLLSTPFDEQWHLLRKVVDEVLEEQSHVHAFAPVERRALIGDDATPGLLKRWLALERDDQQTSGFMPVLFEQEIEIEIELPVDDRTVRVPVKTRIDRIDIREVQGALHVAVVDYKSSLSGSFSTTNVHRGLASQMPMYLAAVRTWFAHHGIDVAPEAAVYRAFGTALQAPDKLERRVVLADMGSPMVQLVSKRAKAVHTPLLETLDSILQLLQPGVEQLQSGMYPVRPLKAACDTCRVTHVCRKDHWGILVATTVEEECHDEEG